MNKLAILFFLLAVLFASAFLLVFRVLLDHEERQAEEDFKHQIQAATWRLEL